MMSAKDKKKGSLVPRLRFPEFRDEWTYDNLGDFLEEYSEKVNADTTLPIYSSTRDGLKAQKDYFNGHELINSGEYGVVPVNCFVYRHMSDDNIFIFNINLIGGAIAVSKEYPVFKAKNMSPLFLYYILNYGLDFKRFAAMQKKGGTRTRLYFSTLCSWKTLLPTKPEQQRIADCLSSLDERIAAETNKLDALKAHKKGLLKQLFPAEGETLPQLRFPEFQDAGEWEEVPLSKLVSSLDAGVSVNAGDRPATSEEMGILKTSAVTNGVFEPQENKVVLDVVEIGRMRESVRRNTIIISRMNTPALVGANAYVDTNFENIFLPDRLWAAKPKPDTSMRFISFILSSNQGRATLALSAKGSSGSMKNITKSDVLAFLAMIPSLPEQQRIAGCLSSLDELITAQTQKIDLLKDHKKGLMQQLFPCIDEVRA